MNGMIQTFKQGYEQAHPSRHQWDLFVLNVLSQKEETHLQSHLVTCTYCNECLQEVRREQKEWEQQIEETSFSFSSESMAVSSHQDVSFWATLFSGWQSAFWTPVGALGMFLLLWGLAPSSGQETLLLGEKKLSEQTLLSSGVRSKGTPSLFVYRSYKDTSRLLVSKAHLKEGDILGLRYQSQGFRYLFVVLLDQKGEISWLYPSRKASSLSIGERGRLAGSIELDGALGEERLLAFFSALPLQADEVKQLIRKNPTKTSGYLTLPHQPAQKIYLDSFLIQK